MINEERIVALQRFGYTERQAAFLCLAALHGGYFLRRQCNTFFGLEPGGTTERLIQKAIEKGHVHVHPSANQTLIYHVGNKVFFEAIGEEDNRNRRWRQPYSVKVKLMGFDFVLSHPNNRYLATESEKVEYFSGTLGLALESLPARIYRSKKSHNSTTRHFVDKFPVFLSGAPSAPSPVVGFCYVDGNIGKPSGFDTYVNQYRELWNRLGSAEVIYCSADWGMFAKAKRIFQRLSAVDGVKAEPFDVGELLEHFRMRHLFERRETATLSRAELDRLRDDLENFRGMEYETLYQRWESDGKLDSGILDRKKEGGGCCFKTCELRRDWGLFGELTRSALKGARNSEGGFVSGAQ